MPQAENNTGLITVLGAGSWGLTLSWLFSEAGKSVCIYTNNQEKAEAIVKEYRIEKPLPVKFNAQKITVTSDLGQAIEQAHVIILCCTSQSMRSVAQRLAQLVKPRGEDQSPPILVSAVKGLELNSLKRMSEILEEILPGTKISVLSGPNLAREILQGLPAAAVVASQNIEIATYVQKVLTVPKFRLYSNTDVIGVELGGAFKNVIAIAAGGADGLDLGANAKSALLTRGLAEMTRLSMHMGAKPSTLAGLAGLGDLLATCSGPLSRNYNLGLEMTRGKSLQTIEAETGAVIEGVTTTQAVCQLGEAMNIDLPIARLVKILLDGSLSPTNAIMTLMNRPLVRE